MNKIINGKIINVIITVCFFIIVGIIIFSCNKNKVDNPNTIRFWHFWSEPHQKKVVIELIEKFEKENNCKVEMTELSWNDGKTKLFAAFNSNVAPDVLELGSDWVTQFSSSNVLSIISPDSINMDNFVETSLSPTKWENNIYAVPWIIDTRVMFYNKSLMQAAGFDTIPPQDYTELVNMANTINNVSKNIYGFGTNGSDPHRLYKKVLPLFWTFGGEILDSTGKPMINSISNVSALNMYVQLSRTGIIETQRQLDTYFAQGKIAFIFSGAWMIKKIENENPNLDYGVAIMPRYLLNQGISFLGGEYLAINKTTKKKELALKLIKYLTDGKNSLKLAQQIDEAGFPADKNFINDKTLLKNSKKNVFSKQLLFAKPTPIHPKWLDIEAIIENSIAETIYGQKSEFQALNEAQIEVLKLFNE